MGIRIAIYIVGLVITALGIALIILSEVGAGPWDTVAVGLNKHLGLTIGMWSIISQAVVVLITALIEKTPPQLGSVMAILIRSCFLDFWIYIVFRNNSFAASFEVQWLSFTLGIITVGVGIGMYLEAKLPKTPIDGLMVAFYNRFGWSFNVARIVIESSAALLGFLLGGPVGLGTLIIALTLGRVIQFSNQGIEKILKSQKVTVSKTYT